MLEWGLNLSSLDHTQQSNVSYPLGSQSADPRSAAAETPGTSLETQSLKPHPRPTEPEGMGWGLAGGFSLLGHSDALSGLGTLLWALLCS